jgi:hypothetical protein
VRRGATIAELAEAFDVVPSTIWQWKLNHAVFFESCRVGLEVANDRVEHSLYERAVGYTHESTKIFMPAGAFEPVYAPYLEHVPPDPRAGEFWLTNRAPERWKNRQSGEPHEDADCPIRRLASGRDCQNQRSSSTNSTLSGRSSSSKRGRRRASVTTT